MPSKTLPPAVNRTLKANCMVPVSSLQAICSIERVQFRDTGSLPDPDTTTDARRRLTDCTSAMKESPSPVLLRGDSIAASVLLAAFQPQRSQIDALDGGIDLWGLILGNGDSAKCLRHGPRTKRSMNSCPPERHRYGTARHGPRWHSTLGQPRRLSAFVGLCINAREAPANLVFRSLGRLYPSDDRTATTAEIDGNGLSGGEGHGDLAR